MKSKIWKLFMLFAIAFFCINHAKVNALGYNESSPLDLLNIEATKVKTSYYNYEDVGTDDIVVIATYKNGTSKQVYDFKATVYFDYIEVAYTEGDITRKDTIDLSIRVTEWDRIEAEKTNTSYREGETVNLNDIILYGVSNNRRVKQLNGFTSFFNTTSGEVEITYTESTTYKTSIPIIYCRVRAISAEKAKTKYETGTKPDFNDLSVYAIYEDGSKKKVTNYDIEYTNGSTIARIDYNINNRIYSDTIQLSFAKLQEINVALRKTSYSLNETLNKNDITVTAIYSDGSKEVVNNFEAKLDFTNKWVVVTYEEGSVTKTSYTNIKVVTLVSISATKEKTKYSSISETVQTNDIKVYAKYSDNSTKEITKGYTSSTTSGKQIKITYEEGGVKVSTTIPLSICTLSSITATKTKTAYKKGETVNVDDITVVARYTDNSTETKKTGFVAKYNSSTSKVDVSYTEGGITKTTSISITNGTMSSISATKEKRIYYPDETVSTNDITLKITYSDGSTSEITSGFIATYSSYYKRVDISYTEGGKTLSTNVSLTFVTLSSISATKEKTKYVSGETVDTNGITVKATYSDGSSKEVSGFKSTYSSYTKEITVTYTAGGISKSSVIKISMVSLNSITVTKDKTTYKDTETIDTRGITVKANYSDGSSVKVSDYTATVNSTKDAINVTYKQGSTTKTATIPLKIIYFTTTQMSKKNLKVRENAEPDLKDVEVYAIYSDYSKEEIKKPELTYDKSTHSIKATYKLGDKECYGYLYLDVVYQSSIDVYKQKTNYENISKIKTDDITVDVVYSDGTKDENVTGFTTELTKGTTTEYGSTSTYVTVSYKGFSKSFNAIVKLKIDGQTYTQTESNIIDKVGECGIMMGTDKGFEPTKTLTRAEAATIIVRLSGVSEDSLNSYLDYVRFSDCPLNYWGTKYINAAADLGLVKGTGNGKFSPNATVTIAEFSTMAIRALGAGEIADARGTWPNNYIELAKEEGILYETDTNCTGVSTRIKAATIVSETLDKKPYQKNTSGKLVKQNKTYFDLYLKGKAKTNIVCKVSSNDYDLIVKSLSNEFVLIERNKQAAEQKARQEAEAKKRAEEQAKKKAQEEARRKQVQTTINNNSSLVNSIQSVFSKMGNATINAGNDNISSALSDLKSISNLLSKKFTVIEDLSSSKTVSSRLNTTINNLNNNVKNVSKVVSNNDKKNAINNAISKLASDLNSINEALSAYKDEAKTKGYSIK